MKFLKAFNWHVLRVWLYSVITIICSMYAFFLVQKHVTAIFVTTQVSVPELSTINSLERTKDFLKAQMELTQLQDSIELKTQNEQVQAFTIPSEFATDRIVQLFDVFCAYMASIQEECTMNSLQYGTESVHDLYSRMPVTINVTVSPQASNMLLALMQNAGIVTVYDALTVADRDVLISYTESENPAAISDLEALFAIDLLNFMQEPELYIQNVLRSFHSAAFEQALRNALHTSQFVAANLYASGAFGDTLQVNKLWPLPFIEVSTIKKSSISAATQTVVIDFSIFKSI